MSFTLISAVWEYGPDDSTQQHVLLALADYADDDGTSVFPALETVAQKCRMSRSTAARALKALVADGWITSSRRGPSSNSYTIQVANLAPRSVNLASQDAERDVNLTSHTSPRSVILTPKKSQNDTSRSVILTPDPITITNHSNQEEEAAKSSPTDSLRDHFRQRTAIEPNDRTGTYERDWLTPLGRFLELTNGDVAAACVLIDRALAVAWGDNERRKTYTVSCPRSIVGIAVNQAMTAKATAATVDADSLWATALRAIREREYEPRLKAAIRAIGGTGRIVSANGHDTEQLKRALALEYQRSA